MGPYGFLNGFITPISRDITPVTQIFSTIYRGAITPFITSRGRRLWGKTKTHRPTSDMPPKNCGWLMGVHTRVSMEVIVTSYIVTWFI